MPNKEIVEGAIPHTRKRLIENESLVIMSKALKLYLSINC